ncbi:MAG: hypothetical protein JNK72_22480 [Myxococcales bacterium]|nr:hypothetical protein [Myxococcales bacterium]
MNPDAARLATALGALSLGLTYLATTAGKLGLFYYLPTAHRWTLAPPTALIAMDWFARALWSLVALALGFGSGLALARRWPTRAATLTRALWSLAVVALSWSAVFTAMWLVYGR